MFEASLVRDVRLNGVRYFVAPVEAEPGVVAVRVARVDRKGIYDCRQEPGRPPSCDCGDWIFRRMDTPDFCCKHLHLCFFLGLMVEPDISVGRVVG